MTGLARASRPDSLDAFAPAAGDGGLQTTPGASTSDSVPDVLVGPNSGSRPVRLLSGVDGSEIASGFPFGSAFTGGVRVAYADLTGDGVPDPITAMGNGGGLVRLYDGATFANFISGYPFGPAFAGGLHVAAGDVSGDGRADVIVAQGSAGGEVRVYNAADATLLASGAPFGPSYMGGVRVASGDVNSDGRADVIVAQASGGTVSVFSGVDQTLLVSGQPYGAGFLGGIFVATGDVNADNHADIIIAPGIGSGPVMVVDGRTYAVLGTFPAYVPLFVGGVRVATADLTGDGRADIITAPGAVGVPLLQVFDGATFNLVAQAFAYDPLFLGGVFVAGPSSPGRLRVTSAATTTFTIGEAGTFAITTTGTPPATTVTQAGALPDGVTFSDNGDGTATLAGTPTAGSGGTYSLTLTASNGVGPDATQTFTLEVVDTAPQVTATTPANGATDVAFDTPLVVTFSEPVNAGAGAFTLECPAGTPVPVAVLTASPAAEFTLDPTVDLPPTVTCTLRVDSALVTDADADDPPDTLAADFVASFTTSACASITVSPTTLAGGNVTIAYTPVTFTQVGGVAPISWSVTSGSLPPGLTLAASTGELSGTPTTAGPFSFTVTATSATGCTGSAPLTLNIAAGPNQAPSFVAGPAQTINEDSGAQSVPGWATAISPGPADEAAQIVSFNVAGNTNPALFSAAPAVSSTGALTYTPAANANGTATITLTLSDNGGTALGGADTSAPQNVVITVNAVNDVPSFTAGMGPTVMENVGPQTFPGVATAVSPGPADEAGQTLTFAASNNAPSLFSVQPAVSSSGELTFEPASSAAGTATITLTLSDNGGTAFGGVDTSASQTFTITITGVNSAPSFTKGADQTVNEDSGAQTVAEWAKSISPGPADEADQAVAFNVTGNSNPSLFSAGPAVSPAGDLTYTPAANANGTATITLAAQDDGGTANGGIDASPAQTFVITVNAVNDAPSFTKGLDQTVFENGGAQTVPGWVLAASAGPGDEAGQTLTYVVTGNTNPGLFSAGPAVSSAGALTYTLLAGESGTATITLEVRDSGGTANGGVDASPSQTFTITVTPVNDAPSFTKGPDDTVLEDSGQRVVTPWATAISPGPGDEAGQIVVFDITGNTNPGLFSDGPAVSSAGVLIYTPAANASGVANITLTLQDNGGTAGGGDDTSDAQTFTITVTEVNDAPSFAATINPSSAEDAGAQSLSNWASSISPGPANEAAQTLTFSVTGNTNPSLFAVGGAPAVSSTGTLTYTSAANAFGTSQITVVLQDNGGTANGGANTSAPHAFTITVTPVNDAPTVVNETFDILGNTEFHVDRTPGATPSTSETTTGPSAYLGVLDNDSDPEGDPFAVTAITDCSDTSAPFECALPSGAVIHVEANGAFSFVPQRGATSGGFTYTATDTPAAGAPASVTGTVTFTAAEMIWYVDGNVAGPGTGTSADPFDTFTATNLNGASDLDDADDYIFVFDSGISAGIALEQGQHLIAEFAGLSIPVSLNGNAAPTVVVPAGGIRSSISASGPAITIGNAIPAEIRGFSLTSTGDAINMTTNGAMVGTSPLALTISNNEFASAGGEGVDVAMNAGTSGALLLQVTGNTWDTGGTHTGNAVNVNHVAAAGSLALDISSNTNVKSNGGAGIFVNGGSVASTTIMNFDGNWVHGDTVGAGVSVQNVRFDNSASPGVQPVSGGSSAIGLDGNGVGGTALSITASEGALAYIALQAHGANGLNLSGAGSPLSFSVNPGAGVIKSTAGKAVQTSSVALNLPSTELVSSGADAGVSLSSTTGTFSTTTGSSITKGSGTGAAFSVANSNMTVGYAGSLSVTAGSGVSLSSNAGSTVTFSGGVSLSTGANAAFAATGGGTVEVCDENPCNAAATGGLVNTLTTTTATALNVANTTIGAGGLEFRSVSSNGAPTGIVLNTTGSSGGLRVKGTGTAGSGGTINASTGPGINLTSTAAVALSHVNVQNGGDDGIRGATVAGLNLTGLNVTSNGDAVGESGIDLTQLTGSASMASTTVTGSGEHNVHLANTSGTLTAFNVTSGTFATTDFTTGGDGFLVENNGSGSMAVSITGSTFTDNKGDHFQAATSASATGSMALVFSTNTLTTTPGNDPNVLGGGITISPSGSTDVTFTINGNTINQAFDEGINLNLGTASTAAASMVGTVSNNIVGVAGEVDSGSESGSGIVVTSNGAGLTTVSVTNNQVRQFANPYGILVNHKEGSSTMNVTVTGNTVANPGTFAINGIRVDSGATASDTGTVCAAVSGNLVAGSGPAADPDIRLRQRFGTTIRLPGYAGGASDTDAVAAFVVGNNSGADATAAHNVGGGGFGFVGGAACPTP